MTKSCICPCMTGSSRLDFCLVSSHFKSILKKVEHTLLSTLFDHHAVIISLAFKQKVKKKSILDDLIDDRICIRVIKFSNFIQKYDILRNNLNENVLLECEKLIQIYGQIAGIKQFLLKTFNKFLLTLRDASYAELFRLLDKVKDVTMANISGHIRPGLSLVLLLNAVKIDLLSISGSWISS